MKKILFTGGGSAGHVLPNVALIEELLSDGDVDICYMGTNGIEKTIISEWKIPYYQIECPKLVRGKSLTAFRNNLKIPSTFLHSIKQAKAGLRAFQPDAVFSKGGYVSLPVVFAAHKLDIPCYTHESDFSIGLANKLMANKCKHVFTSFPETASRIPNGKYSGAPLRSNVFSYGKAEARKRHNIPFNATVILVFGGGSGSVALNETIRKHLKTLAKDHVILHACGKGNIVKSNVENYYQFEFISDMGVAYACADVVVSRSGAGTVFELLALKKPSILVPLEGQTRGDQVENANYFHKKGLCYVLRQNELHKLPQEIEKILTDNTLKERLLMSSFNRGNDVILKELRSVLRS